MRRLKVYKRILILCEGMTEYYYAKSLQKELPRDLQRSINLEIFDQKPNDPRSLALAAWKRVSLGKKDGNGYDAVWLFFDHDHWPQLSKAFDLIKRDKFRIAFTVICIEHWFILHFENCGRAFQNAEEATRYLTRLWPEYHKTRINAYSELKDQLDIAIDRAKILNRNQEDGIALMNRNPYFSIHELIMFFEDLKMEFQNE